MNSSESVVIHRKDSCSSVELGDLLSEEDEVRFLDFCFFLQRYVTSLQLTLLSFKLLHSNMFV